MKQVLLYYVVTFFHLKYLSTQKMNYVKKKYTGAAMFFSAKNEYAVRSPKNSNDAIKYHYS